MPKTSQIRGIEEEAKRRSLADDGKTSHAERFKHRAALRAEAGLPPEEHVKGGFAGFTERNPWALPVAALAAPFALPAIGGLLGGGVGAAGAGAASAVPAVAGGAGLLGGIGGAIGKAGDFLGSDAGRGLMGAVTAIDAASQRRRQDDLTNEAVGRDLGRWEDNAPLRDAGMQALLNPTAPDLGSLGAIAARGNPFAGPPPSAVPAVPPPMPAAPMAPTLGVPPTLPAGPVAATPRPKAVPVRRPTSIPMSPLDRRGGY